MNRKRSLTFFLALLASAAATVYAADATRRHEVARRGAQVMPFDLEQTTHFFEPLKDGGLQRVTVKDPKNQTQIALIRTHLKDVAARFRRGDFSDPEAIHGADMPGLAELSKGAARVDVQYAARADGAEIRYRTQDPALVDAIHRWFRAQVTDHGRHAADHAHGK